MRGCKKYKWKIQKSVIRKRRKAESGWRWTSEVQIVDVGREQ